jgi:murein hydrolase activator
MRSLSLALLALVAGGLAIAGGVAQAPDGGRDSVTARDLETTERARDAALERLRLLETRGEAAAREASAIEADLLSAAADSRRLEDAANRAEARIADLEQAEAIARNLLDQDGAASEDLLAALMMLGARPPPALAASPEDTGAAIRAAILMGDVAPELGGRANALRDRISVLVTARARIAAERDGLRRSEQALAARRGEIEALASEKRLANTDLATRTAALRAEADRLGREAEDLRSLLAGLAKSAPAGAAQGLQAGRTGAPSPRTSPATGQIVHAFGESDLGERQPGLTLSTRPDAQIVSPGDARVAFAADFRSYGGMLILDMGHDELVILSGLDVLYPEAGQWVLAGEPVGRMSGRKQPDPELYLEVRRAGHPVDPAGWLGRGV